MILVSSRRFDNLIWISTQHKIFDSFFPSILHNVLYRILGWPNYCSLFSGPCNLQECNRMLASRVQICFESDNSLPPLPHKLQDFLQFFPIHVLYLPLQNPALAQELHLLFLSLHSTGPSGSRKFSPLCMTRQVALPCPRPLDWQKIIRHNPVFLKNFFIRTKAQQNPYRIRNF